MAQVIRDLLGDSASARPTDKVDSQGLKLREAKGTGVYVEGLKEVPIANVREGLSLIVAGEERRKVCGPTYSLHPPLTQATSRWQPRTGTSTVRARTRSSA